MTIKFGEKTDVTISSGTNRIMFDATGAIGLRGANYGNVGDVITNGTNRLPTWTAPKDSIDLLTDTNVSNLQDNQILKYNTTTLKWENAAETNYDLTNIQTNHIIVKDTNTTVKDGSIETESFTASNIFYSVLTFKNGFLGLGSIRSYVSSSLRNVLRLAPSSLSNAVAGIFVNSRPTTNETDVKAYVGINSPNPARHLEVGTSLYVDDTNKRVGINVADPTKDLQVGTTLYADNVTQRVGINKADPLEDLHINGTVRIDDAKLKFHGSGNNNHLFSEIEGVLDGTQGGDIRFLTKPDTQGGQAVERLRINHIGAIGIGGNVYGNAGQFLKSNGSGSAVSWDTPIDTTYTYGTGVSISPSNVISIGQSVATSDNPSFTQMSLGVTGINQGIINLNDVTDVGTENVAQIRGILDGNNGGNLEFNTKADGGVVTEKLRINNLGAIGIGGANYGNDGEVLMSRGQTLPPIWGAPSGGGISAYHSVTINQFYFQGGVRNMSGFFNRITPVNIISSSTVPFTIPAGGAGIYLIGYGIFIGGNRFRYAFIQCLINGNNSNQERICFHEDQMGYHTNWTASRSFVEPLNDNDTITFQTQLQGDLGGQMNYRGQAYIMKIN